MHIHKKVFRINMFVFSVFTALFLASCEKNDELEIPQIGEIKDGGIVAHIFKPGEEGYVEGEVHGIITAPVDVVFESQWGCQGSAVGGTSSAVGRGRSNTQLVMDFHNNLPNFFTNPSQCHPNNDGSVAARVALEFSTGEFNDWFMPSLHEMNHLYNNRAAIGGFTNSEYWSSCESNAWNACVMSFVTGEMLSKPKSEFRRVRVIRFF
jgi:hypothetical protein